MWSVVRKLLMGVAALLVVALVARVGHFGGAPGRVGLRARLRR
ncbi:hypothetical protein [Aeromicrobium sp.]|nr:hypothetical protein [Aeromicrobium sp.]